MKKFFSLLFFVVFLSFSTFSLASCKKNEVEKFSKDLNEYSISAKLDDEKKEVVATEKFKYVNKTETVLDELYFHLYPRAFREGAVVKPYTTLTEASCFPNGVNFGDIEIKKVTAGGKDIAVEFAGEDEDVLRVKLNEKLKQKKSIEIAIEFVLKIPNSTHRFGWFDGNINLGNWYPVVCEFLNGEFELSPYYSTGDPFVSSVANYDVEFEFLGDYLLCSTGKINLTKNGEKNIAKISAKAVRDFAMVLSSKSKLVSKNIDGLTVNYLGYENDNEFKKFLNVSAEAVQYFSDLFGQYPYSTLTVVKSPFIYGGMEFPNMVIISDSVDDEDEFLKVIVHEIAHQWWYGVVGNNQIKEAWLDESLAEYSTALFFERFEKYGIGYDELVKNAMSSYMLYVDVIQTIRGEVNTKMNLAVNEYQNDYEYSYMVYVKGVIMFDSLRTMVGEKKVVAGLKKYYKTNKFKIATKKDFYSAFNSACHKDLENFFNGYLNGTTIISAIN